ncbi:MAG: 6,7-dimethyl-8-ribityllumazine synthase [Flavobacteriales bacterium AspAUS03]
MKLTTHIFSPREISAKSSKFGLVTTQWSGDITANLYKCVYENLLHFGDSEQNIYNWEIPGGFELIYATDKLCQRGDLDVTIVIWVLIKVEIRHFEYIYEAVSKGIKYFNLKYDIPLIFFVLTDENKQKSIDRSDVNKDTKCSETVVKMALFKKSLYSP